MSLAPYTVWIIVQKNREGKPCGVEKTFNGHFYCDTIEAGIAFNSIDPSYRTNFMIAEVVMMGAEEFRTDYNPVVED